MILFVGLHWYCCDSYIACNLRETLERQGCVDLVDVSSVIVDITQYPCERSCEWGGADHRIS